MIVRAILLFLAVTVTHVPVHTDAQTVANQCLAEQSRNNAVANQRRPVTAEEITMASFDAICRNYNEYVGCFTSRLPSGTQAADQFLNLNYDARSLRAAYQGLCTLDIETLRPNIRCLLSTPEVRRCYNTFNVQVNQVINLKVQQQFPRNTLEELSCNASVARYRCETAVYGFCNQRAGKIMQDFFYATVPRQCQERTGITSRYTTLFNASIRNTGDAMFVSISILASLILSLWRL